MQKLEEQTQLLERTLENKDHDILRKRDALYSANLEL
jgi:hypothetical protein